MGSLIALKICMYVLRCNDNAIRQPLKLIMSSVRAKCSTYAGDHNPFLHLHYVFIFYHTFSKSMEG